jgi:hypothetical protein
MEKDSEPKKENKEPALAGVPQSEQNFPKPVETRLAECRRAAPRLVERATALRGQSIGRPPEPKSVLRRRTLMDICSKDPEIPYVKFEKAIRDLVCSLMERQDRMNEAIFYKINDLSYRVEDLEQDRQVSAGGDP